MGFKDRLQRLGLKVLTTLAPNAEEDSWADLKREELEGKISRAGAPQVEAPALPPAELARKPIYRRDGQIHNFNAKPWPGRDGKPAFKTMTSAQYEARYGGARPEPKHSVAKFVHFETQPEDFLPGAADNMGVGPTETVVDENGNEE